QPNGRLGNVKLERCACQAAFPGDRDKGGKCLDIHRIIISFSYIYCKKFSMAFCSQRCYSSQQKETQMPEQEFDYVIVGAGTAGCLLANRLSADPSKSVLLIEAGGKDNYHWLHIPVAYLYCIGNARTDWLYSTEPDKGLNGRVLRYPRGKTLGGCSSINGMIYMRGQARDYDHWAASVGDDAWSWESCLADFKAHENHYRLDLAVNSDGKQAGAAQEAFAKFHASGGEWRIEKQRLRWDILDAFAAAAQQAGIAATDDFNQGDNEGVG